MSKSPPAKMFKGETQSITSPIETVTAPKDKKGQVIQFVEKIFCTKMSSSVLVDIVMDTNSNLIVVGRPEGLYSNRQVRHVIPYSFIVNAIKSIVTSKVCGYMEYLNNILDATLSLMHKPGICLTEEQFKKLLTFCQTEDFPYFQLRTHTKKGDTINTYYMVYTQNTFFANVSFSDIGFTDNQINNAQNEFQNKFRKYVQYEITRYANNRVNQDNEYAIITFLEAITRMILSVSNTNIDSAFPPEGNSISTEIRLYDDESSAVQALNNYTLCSQAKIVRMITAGEKNYNKCIRIVNNEGSLVLKVSNALVQLNTLMDSEILEKEYNTRQDGRWVKLKECSKEEYTKCLYNKYNNLYVPNNPNKDLNISNHCTIPLNSDNIKNLFQYHVATHLYSIFDFKPLENKVLVPRTYQPNQPDEENIILVYPSAKGKTRTVEYVVTEGYLYRKTQCNSATGYDNPRFLSELKSEDILNILKDKIVTYINLALVPFAGLRNGCTDDDDESNGTSLIMEAFCTLIQEEYKLDGNVILDPEYLQQIKDVSTNLNLSGQSSIMNELDL